MRKKHSGLVIAGLILVYIFGSSLAGLFIYAGLDLLIYGYAEGIISALISLFALSAVVLAALYHANKIDNYVLVGIFGILVSIIGGIFILAGQPNEQDREQKNDFHDDLTALEYKLRQLDTLLTKGVLSKEEYDAKRKTIIENY